MRESPREVWDRVYYDALEDELSEEDARILADEAMEEAYSQIYDKDFRRA